MGVQVELNEEMQNGAKWWDTLDIEEFVEVLKCHGDEYSIKSQLAVRKDTGGILCSPFQYSQ